MSLFSAILEKLGFGKKSDATTAKNPESTITTTSTEPVTAAPQEVRAMDHVDVVAKLDGMAAASPQKLNWKVSIVDLLKLLSLDSSFEARKSLAIELACPKEKMADSAQMNMWLHKTVLQRLAENGGNIPKDLL